MKYEKPFLATAQRKFLGLGFLGAGLFVITAFSIVVPVDDENWVEIEPAIEDDVTIVVEPDHKLKKETVTYSEKLAPSPVTKPKPIIEEIDVVDKKQVDLNVDLSGLDDEIQNTIEIGGEKLVEEKRVETRDFASKMPRFGPCLTVEDEFEAKTCTDKALVKYIQENVSVPQYLLHHGIDGTFYVSFIVGTTGEVEDISFSKSLHSQMDKEVTRLLERMPSWTVGMQNGEKVRVRYNIPITIVLE